MESKVLLVNPRARRRPAAKKRRVTRRRRNPIATTAKRRSTARRRPAARPAVRRRVRRNPSARGVVNAQLMPAAVGAGGAILNDLVFGYLPLPTSLQTGYGKQAAKGALAIVLGMVAKNFMRGTTALQMSNGALTVVLRDMAGDAIGQNFPSIQLGRYMPSRALGRYMPGQMNNTPDRSVAPQLAYMNPGRVSGRIQPARATMGR